MATEAECRAAIDSMLEKLADVDPERRKTVPDRTIGCTLLDLDITYVGEIRNGEVRSVRKETGDFHPQVRLVCTSDDLLSLADGSLGFAHAWATGRVRLDASLRDLLRLRALG